MRPTPNQTAGCAHLGCGVWVGAMAGMLIMALFGDFEDLLGGVGWWWALPAIGASVCGWLAVRRREAFWDKLGEGLDDECARERERRGRLGSYLPRWWRW